MLLNEKIVIITGASKGIGYSVAKLFSLEGAHVILFARNRQHLENLAVEIIEKGGKANYYPGDVSDENDVDNFFSYVKENYGKVDIVVNCAGVMINRSFHEMDSKTWDNVIDINLRGTFLFCLSSFKIMKKQMSGIIINISSLSGVKGVEKFPGLCAYNSSKYAIAGLSESLALEGRPFNIRVCTVSPGAVDTDMLQQSFSGLKSIMKPDDMAQLLLYISTDAGRFFNGSNIELYTNI